MNDPQPNAGPTPYELLGGEAAVRGLVDRFYDLMTSSRVRRHPQTPPAGARRLAGQALLVPVGWLGGPPV